MTSYSNLDIGKKSFCDANYVPMFRIEITKFKAVRICKYTNAR